jgi:septation ring formation regulator EzrA
MNRASDHETRLVALEEQMLEVLRHLEELTEGQKEIRRDINQMRELQVHMSRAILKFNREISAQRERYPL